jgi:hypothetical protein
LSSHCPLETPTADKPKTPWDRLIELAGATAGLAALLYFVGAATLWLRLKVAGYPQEVALEHTSSVRLVALGLQGTLVVIAIALPVALVVVGYLALRDRIRPVWRNVTLGAIAGLLIVLQLADAHEWIGQKAAAVLAIILVSTGLTLIWPKSELFWAVSVVAAIAMFALASTASWRFFGMTIGLVIAVTVIGYLVRFGANRRQRFVLLLGSLAIAVAVAAIAWQVDGATVVQAVRISRKSSAPLQSVKREARERCAFPYFGQSGDFVYVGEVEVRQGDEPPCSITNAILEIPRDEVEVRFVEEQPLPLKTPEAPFHLFKRLATDFWGAVDDS